MCNLDNLQLCSKKIICARANWTSATTSDHFTRKYQQIVSRRGYNCSSGPEQKVYTSVTKEKSCQKDPNSCSSDKLCYWATNNSYETKIWTKEKEYHEHVLKAKRGNLNCGVSIVISKKKSCLDDATICNTNDLCEIATWRSASGPVWDTHQKVASHVEEAKRRRLSCGIQKIETVIPIPKTARAANYKGVNQLMVVESLDISNNRNKSIILQRCAGLFGAIAKYLPKAEPQKEQIFLHSMDVLTISVMAMHEKRGNQVSIEAVTQQVQKAFTTFVDLYYNMLEQNQILTGSIFDPYVQKELDLCTAMTKG